MKSIKSLINLVKKNYFNEKNINLHRPLLIGNEKKYLNQIIDSSFVSTAGTTILKFENKFKKFTKSKYAIATSSGTSALHISLLLSGCNDKTEVITQPLSFVATKQCYFILWCKANIYRC